MNNQETNTFKKIEESKDGEKETKVILVHGFSNKQLSDFIDYYKKNKELPKTIFASVTKNSINMKIKDLVNELEMEKQAIEKAKKEV